VQKIRQCCVLFNFENPMVSSEETERWSTLTSTGAGSTGRKGGEARDSAGDCALRHRLPKLPHSRGVSRGECERRERNEGLIHHVKVRAMVDVNVFRPLHPRSDMMVLLLLQQCKSERDFSFASLRSNPEGAEYDPEENEVFEEPVRKHACFVLDLLTTAASRARESQLLAQTSQGLLAFVFFLSFFRSIVH
jgi:hypothetical protein